MQIWKVGLMKDSVDVEKFLNLFPGEMVTWLKLQRAAQVGHKEQTATKPGKKPAMQLRV